MKLAIRQFLAVTLTAGLVFIPALQAQQQGKSATPQVQPAPSPGGGGATHPSGGVTYSSAVLTSGTSTIVKTLNKLNVQTATSADIQSAATALQDVFASLEETGANSQMQAWILANASTIKDYSPSTTDVQNLYTSMTKSGAVVTMTQVRNILTVNAEDEEEFVNQISQNGMASVEADIVTSLQQAATSVASKGSVVQVGFQRNSKNRARLLLVNCAANAVAASGLGLAAGLMGAEPVCAAFEMVAIVYGLLSLANVC